MGDWRTGPVVVTGATGHVAGFVLTRLGELPNAARPLGRRDDVGAAAEGADAVIHLAGALRPRGGGYEDANVGTARAMLDGVARSGVRRVVLLSHVGAHPASRNAYLATKGRAEDLVLGAPVEAAVLRSTVIVGPPTSPGPSGEAFVSSAGRPLAVIGTGRQRYAPVAVQDVAEALVRLALDPGAPTGRLALGGPEAMTVEEMVATLSGGPVRLRRLPAWLARLLARAPTRLTPAMVDVLAADSLPDRDLPDAADALGLRLHRLGDLYAGV